MIKAPAPLAFQSGRNLEDRFNLRVEGNVRHRNAVDRESRATGLCEVKKATDVVVLVVTREDPLCFGSGELERRQRHRLTEFSGKRAVAFD